MKQTLLTFLLLFSLLLQGQRRYAADRYFEEYAFKKSAELYQILYDRGNKSYEVISKLGDSYYHTVSFKIAEKIYEELLDRYEDVILPDHLFRYAQVLKSNGKIKESDTWMLKLKDIDGSDSRAIDLASNKDYFSNYTNMPKTYVHIHNLSINTKYSDFSGFVHDDTFYFWSTRPSSKKEELYKWNNQPYLNIYKSEQVPIGEKVVLDVEKPDPMTSLNSKYHDSNLVITKDGQTMYFTRANERRGRSRRNKKGIAHLKIFKAKLTTKGWSKIEELPFNNKDYSIGHPTLSEDEKTLFFTSDKPGGYGSTDLYKVAIMEDGSYGEPENLGDTINTEGREMFPFVASNGKLFFSSDGHIGLGALDIFQTNLKEGKFTKPQNLGEPINGALDDFGFVMNQEETAGYFSSNRKGGKGDDDIYSYQLYNCKGVISGLVTDAKTKGPVGKVTIRILDEKGNQLFKQVTKEDGTYSFDEVECEKKYVVVAAKEDYKSSKNDVYISEDDDRTLKNDFVIDPLIIDGKIAIDPIYFDYGSFQIREDAAYELEKVVSVMKNYPEMIIKIESHTDSRGTYMFNKRLSNKRAIATRDYIVFRGIELQRIQSAKGYGESRPINDCNKRKCSKEEHQQNRRSYFIIIKKGTSITD